MQCNPTPSKRQRENAARDLRERARALRELAANAKTDGPLAQWAMSRAADADAIAGWVVEPFGRCDECCEVLEHFDDGQVGGVLCPRCDGFYVSELAAVAS